MELQVALVGLGGVALGAVIAPFVEEIRERLERRREHRADIARLLAQLLAASGDLAHYPEAFDTNTMGISPVMTKAYDARWQLEFLAPRAVADLCQPLIEASEELASAMWRKAEFKTRVTSPGARLTEVDFKSDDELGSLYGQWEEAHDKLVAAGNSYLNP